MHWLRSIGFAAIMLLIAWLKIRKDENRREIGDP